MFYLHVFTPVLFSPFKSNSFFLTVLLVCADKITVKALGGESKQH